MLNSISIILVLFASLQIAGQENGQLQHENEDPDAQTQVSEADDNRTLNLVVFDNIDASATERKDDGDTADDVEKTKNETWRMRSTNQLKAGRPRPP